jgi:PelA/Pel-15E family pectate lyase
MTVRWFLPGLVLWAACGLPGQGAVRWNDVLKQPAAWYASTEARAVADCILQFQTESGGWPKNVDMTRPPAEEFLASTAADHRAPTIDNGATHTQLRFLAQVVTATGDRRYRGAFEHGFDYLLTAQYLNGGWPQFFPLIKGYYTHITYNDDAMVGVLGVLRDASEARAPCAFVDPARRARAAAAVARATVCILRTQVWQDLKPTVWCAQHDETTFAPAWARNFEPPSLSGDESVGLVRFLMGIEHPSPEVRAAIEGAVAWFRAVAITGLRIDNSPGADGKKDRHAVPDPQAPLLWARFYELGPAGPDRNFVNRPIYVGRDRVIRHDLNEIERERRTGYNYLGTWPARLLEQDYPRWRAKLNLP